MEELSRESEVEAYSSLFPALTGPGSRSRQGLRPHSRLLSRVPPWPRLSFAVLGVPPPAPNPRGLYFPLPASTPPHPRESHSLLPALGPPPPALAPGSAPAHLPSPGGSTPPPCSQPWGLHLPLLAPTPPHYPSPTRSRSGPRPAPVRGPDLPLPAGPRAPSAGVGCPVHTGPADPAASARPPRDSTSQWSRQPRLLRPLGGLPRLLDRRGGAEL